ncbi:MAG: hypothetical protein MIO93_07345 [ANME-2 cluster archaeon]|nr:hypothetical protein [ANME-2 cluster archaeon]
MDTKAIIDGLTGIQGVKGISIMKSDGTVLDSHEILDADNSIIGFSGTTINGATNMFTLGNARRSVIRGPGYKILIIIEHEHYIGVIMVEDADEDMVNKKIEALISTVG